MRELYKRYRPLLARKGWMSSWTYGKLRDKESSDAKFSKDLPLLLEKHRKEQSPEAFAARVQALLQHNLLPDEDKDVIREWAQAKAINLT
jgi:hypothetical protein